VVERVGMAAVIKDFRDGSIVTVEWPTLVDIASSLDRASEQLLWSTYVLQLRVSHNGTLFAWFEVSVLVLTSKDVMNCGCVAQTRAAQAVQAAMNQVSNARDRLSSLTEKEED
jgi:hypothetical protein